MSLPKTSLNVVTRNCVTAFKNSYPIEENWIVFVAADMKGVSLKTKLKIVAKSWVVWVT